VHAGVVAAGGAAIAFPGPSGAGKTTLTVACLLAGLEYGSDEALCLDWETGAVLPYPRPLALTPAAAELAGAGGAVPGWDDPMPGRGDAQPGRDDPVPSRDDPVPGRDDPVPSRGDAAASRGDAASGRGGPPAGPAGEILLTVADIGARVAAEPLALTHLVLLRRSTTAIPAALRPAPRSAAVAELLRRSFTSHRRPEQAFTLAHRTVGAATTWWLDLGDPRAAASLLAGLVRGQ
jgi:hypothetical protein